MIHVHKDLGISSLTILTTVTQHIYDLIIYTQKLNQIITTFLVSVHLSDIRSMIPNTPHCLRKSLEANSRFQSVSRRRHAAWSDRFCVAIQTNGSRLKTFCCIRGWRVMKAETAPHRPATNACQTCSSTVTHRFADRTLYTHQPHLHIAHPATTLSPGHSCRRCTYTTVKVIGAPCVRRPNRPKQKKKTVISDNLQLFLFQMLQCC